MKETTPIIEYGVPIDAQVMVEPPDVTELELEPGHPGLGDAAYVQRRKELFTLCRQHRLNHLGPPLIDYTAEETRIWREVSPKLDELHIKHASQLYLDAKRELAITREEIPQLLRKRLAVGVGKSGHASPSLVSTCVCDCVRRHIFLVPTLLGQLMTARGVSATMR